jgi:EAL domain-containing protein (putative c-di-GMP-specific phosphodiesterase class I)
MSSASAIPPARGSGFRVPAAATRSSSTGAALSALAVATDATDAVRRLHQAAIRRVLHDGGPQIVYQPQLSLSRLVVDGYEALARFPETPIRGTEQWFARARELGMAPELEASAIERALLRRHELPEGTTLAINLSPGVLTSAAVDAVLPADLTGIEIELTEHEWVPGGGRLRRRLDLFRERGARIAIDDVGVAHSGLRRVMDLAPHRIKLDRHLVQGVSTSTVKAALIRAVVDFAEHIGAGVVGEGVENLDDLEALAELDVGYAQGWVVGLPEPDFEDADPIAVAAGRDSLNAMLAGRGGRSRSTAPDPAALPLSLPPPPLTHDRTAGVDELLAELGTVTDLAGLAALAGTCAGVLGADTLMVSVVQPDGVSVQAIQTPDDDGTAGRIYRLADYPLTRACLETRSVMPLYLGTVGDEAEWQVLAGLGYAAALLVPVISRNRVIGLVECYRNDAAPWTRRQIRSARTIAAMLGPVLDLTSPHPHSANLKNLP